MKICFLGTSHAAQHLAAAAKDKGFDIVPLAGAPDLVFVSEDTPTDDEGGRDLEHIRIRLNMASKVTVPVVLTSQVPPGFSRGWFLDHDLDLWHQAETLRIIDAGERAAHPEMIIVGYRDHTTPMPAAYAAYCAAFGCPVLRVTWEEAELSKIAINTFLVAQVETTNALATAAAAVGADWERIAEVLRHDTRIGRQAYLRPGNWADSPHLLRDVGTLEAIIGITHPAREEE